MGFNKGGITTKNSHKCMNPLCEQDFNEIMELNARMETAFKAKVGLSRLYDTLPYLCKY